MITAAQNEPLPAAAIKSDTSSREIIYQITHL